ncbi:MAG: TolC family protein [Betaproteobacteria bacterium]
MLAFSSAADSVESALTLAAAQRRAVERSGQMAAQDFAVASAREMAVAASQLPDPVVRIGIDNFPISGSDRFSLTREPMTMGRIGLMQELTSGDKRQVRAARFEREAERALAQKSSTAATIERDTALAWLDRYYAEAMAAVIGELGGQAKLEIEAAEGAYRAGRGAQAEIFAARGALAAFEDRASEAQRRVRNARVMLARWAGNDVDLPLAGEPAVDLVSVDAATLDVQLAHHPQITVLNRREDVAAAEARIAQANRKSDWTVEVAYQQRGPSNSNMISVGLSIPWQWDRKNRQDRELASKLAMVEQARAEREEGLREHVAEVRIMLNEWMSNRERRARYERELIPLASARTEAVVTAYRGGKSGLAEVLAGRRNEIDVRIQALQLAADIARVWAQINFLVPNSAPGSHPVGGTPGETK